MKTIARVGDYYYSLRVRPEKKSPTYEYVPNKRYSYKDVKRTLAQIGIQVSPSRYWSDLALSTLSDHQIHPYIKWCPGSTLDLPYMDAECGLAHFPIGAEIIYREGLPAPENGKARKLPVYHRATVERLYQLEVTDSEGRESILMNLKALIDKNIEDATSEQTRVPFVVSQRMIQIFINRWRVVSKALEITANPYNPHSTKVYNADAELEDRKRKADLASLTMSSPSTLEGEEDIMMMPQLQPAAPNDLDRQNPEGSGGNAV
jgi:hypothetical protein